MEKEDYLYDILNYNFEKYITKIQNSNHFLQKVISHKINTPSVPSFVYIGGRGSARIPMLP